MVILAVDGGKQWYLWLMVIYPHQNSEQHLVVIYCDHEMITTSNDNLFVCFPGNDHEMIPSGTRQHNYGKLPPLLCRSAISMTICNSKLLVYMSVAHL